MTPRERLFALEQFGIKLGLENIRTLLAALDHPERAYPCVHVAGTNGKGSVTAMVERGLRDSGERTGRYTSPHLFSIEERIAVAGRPIDAQTFDVAAGKVLSVVDRLVGEGALPHQPTFFEVTTAIAFDIFRAQQVSTAIIEVGLGGRFDATNVIAPQVTAITSIDFDHERHLGSTLQQIAFEKAGVIKRGTPVVVGLVPAEAHMVIEQVAAERAAPLIDALPGDRGEPIELALNGRHQQNNAAVAVEVLRIYLGQRSFSGDPRRSIIAALTAVEWPARLEWLQLKDRCQLLIDAAHNRAGARALADYVLSIGAPMPMIFGAMRDKDVAAMVHELSPAVSRFAVVTVDSPRAMPAGELETIVRRVSSQPCDVYDHPREAVAAVCGVHDRAVVAGSIFLVGPLRAQLLAEGAAPVRYPSKANSFFLS
jgi:dihydrofolate synthase/folylpolyglutamate synthase